MSAPAFAQDTAAAPRTEEAAPAAIVITGSRIVRRDYQANSPIQTVGSELLQNSTHLGDRNQPQQAAAILADREGADRAAATSSRPRPTRPGAATISLRGIGAEP